MGDYRGILRVFVVLVCCVGICGLVLSLWLVPLGADDGSHSFLGVRGLLRKHWGCKVGGSDGSVRGLTARDEMEGCSICGVEKLTSLAEIDYAVWTSMPRTFDGVYVFAHNPKSGGSTATKALEAAVGGICPGSRVMERPLFDAGLFRNDSFGVGVDPYVLRTEGGEYIEVEKGEVEVDGGFLEGFGKGEVLRREVAFRDVRLVQPEIWRSCRLFYGHFGPGKVRGIPVETELMVTLRHPGRWRESTWRHEGMYGELKDQVGQDVLCYFEHLRPDAQIAWLLSESDLWGSTGLLYPPRTKDIQTATPISKLRAAIAVLARTPWFGIVDENYWPASLCTLFYTTQANATTYNPSSSTIIRHPNRTALPPHIQRLANTASATEWCLYRHAKAILLERLGHVYSIAQPSWKTQPHTAPTWFLHDQCTLAFHNAGHPW